MDHRRHHTHYDVIILLVADAEEDAVNPIVLNGEGLRVLLTTVTASHPPPYCGWGSHCA